jgi:RNA polymerase sigma-70 factor (ECF subfamily)
MGGGKGWLAVEAKTKIGFGKTKKTLGSAYYLVNLMANDPPNAREPDRDLAPSFEFLVAAQRAPLTRYAARLLGDPARAQDVVQDTFVKFLAQPPGTLEGRAVEWLFTVCRHGALDVLRKEGRMRRLDPEQAAGLAAADPSPGRLAEATELEGLLRGLIARLPPSQQEVVRLKFQNGFSYKEIARITQRSVSHVGVLIHTAVARLRAEWAAQESPDQPVAWPAGPPEESP